LWVFFSRFFFFFFIFLFRELFFYDFLVCLFLVSVIEFNSFLGFSLFFDANFLA